LRATIILDDDQVRSGYVPATIHEEQGDRSGLMTITDFANLVGRVFRWSLAGAEVRMISKFDDFPYVAFGQNGDRWVAVKEIPPGEYYLTTVTGLAVRVNLPKLVARVTNEGSSYVFWTEDEKISLKSKLYPLMIGNISEAGWICLGTTRLKCARPEDIESFIRQVVEAPTTGTYLSDKTRVEQLYKALERKWAPGIGRKRATTLEKLLAGSY
jgi:hypothetical protein